MHPPEKPPYLKGKENPIIIEALHLFLVARKTMIPELETQWTKVYNYLKCPMMLQDVTLVTYEEVPALPELIARLLFVDDLVLFIEFVSQLKDQDSLKLEELLIGEDKIGFYDSHKYLGLEIDFKLSVERMIKERATASRKALFSMRHFLVDKRIPTWSKVLAFKALVYPCLTFGVEIIGMHDQMLHWELNVCSIVAFSAGQRARGFFKYSGLKTWIVDLVKLPGDYRVGEKWSLFHCTTMGCLLVKRAIRLGIVDHRIGTICLLCTEEVGGRLLNWLRGRLHWMGTVGFVHEVNLLAKVIPLYNQTLKDWEVQEDSAQPGLAKGPSRNDTTIEPMPERLGILKPLENSLDHWDWELRFSVGAYPPSHARTWEPNKLKTCV
eukprot:Gb_34408 [translate_table: standard]